MHVGFTRPLPPGTKGLAIQKLFEERLMVVLVAAEQGLSIVPEGVQNLRSDRLVYIPISPKLEPVPLLMCWREQSSSPTLLEFRKQVNSQLHSLTADFDSKLLKRYSRVGG